MVHGATAAGVCAAVSAAVHGAEVVLLEPGRHVGGMTSGGLGYTDLGDPRVVGGLAARFRQAVADAYGVPVGHFAGPEPHVAEGILTDWLAEAGVSVLLGERAVEVAVVDGRITAVRTAAAARSAAASTSTPGTRGTCWPSAGVPAAVGRESRSTYGEAFAGRQEPVPGLHAVPAWISPFADDPTGRTCGPLLPQVKPEPFVPVGEGDGGVMAYGYRACLSRAPDRTPFERPDDYDAGYWELGRRLFAHWAAEGPRCALTGCWGSSRTCRTGRATRTRSAPSR